MVLPLAVNAPLTRLRRNGRIECENGRNRLNAYNVEQGVLSPVTLSKDEKSKIIEQFSINPNDNGSSAVQVALLTHRINRLNEHLKVHRHDESSRRGLLLLVGKRRAHLKYLAATDPKAYRQLLTKLGLRK